MLRDEIPQAHFFRVVHRPVDQQQFQLPLLSGRQQGVQHRQRRCHVRPHQRDAQDVPVWLPALSRLAQHEVIGLRLFHGLPPAVHAAERIVERCPLGALGKQRPETAVKPLQGATQALRLQGPGPGAGEEDLLAKGNEETLARSGSSTSRPRSASRLLLASAIATSTAGGRWLWQSTTTITPWACSAPLPVTFLPLVFPQAALDVLQLGDAFLHGPLEAALRELAVLLLAGGQAAEALHHLLDMGGGENVELPRGNRVTHLFVQHQVHMVRLRDNHALVTGEAARFGECEQLFREALAIYRKHYTGAQPRLANALFGLVNSLGEQGQYADAIPLFEELLAIQEQGAPEPHHAQTYFRLGTLYKDAGNTAKAREIWDRGLRLFPDNSVLKGTIEASTKK